MMVFYNEFDVLWTEFNDSNQESWFPQTLCAPDILWHNYVGRRFVIVKPMCQVHCVVLLRRRERVRHVSKIGVVNRRPVCAQKLRRETLTTSLFYRVRVVVTSGRQKTPLSKLSRIRDTTRQPCADSVEDEHTVAHL
jgi:hypothetical protein